MVDFSGIEISKQLNEILSSYKISFAFQPIFNRKSVIVGYEALMRPEGKVISEFIYEMAEKKLLHEMELLSFFGAAVEYKKRKLTGYLHINSLPSECFYENEIEQFYRNFSDIENQLVIEILEYLVTDEQPWVEKKSIGLRYKGISYALDDFGTGYNGINAITYYDPYIVKIDRSLISGIDSNPSMQNFYNSMVTLLHENNKKVLAEGVETKAEYEWLVSANTDLFQGFFLGKPE